MSSKALSFTIVAAGVVTALLVFLVLVSRSTPRVVAGAVPTESVPVIAAAGFIPAGTALAADRLLVKQLAPDAVPAGAVRSLDQAVGRKALVPLYAGEAVLAPRLSGSATGASAAVAPGRTVFAVPLTPSHAVGGSIEAGDVVAIIGNASSKRDDPLGVIIDEVKVVGIAGEFPFGGRPPQTGAGAASSTTQPPAVSSDKPKVVLVDVTLEQATLLAQVVENGRLYVALKARSTASPATTAAGGR